MLDRRILITLLLLGTVLPARAELTISTYAGLPADRRQIDGPPAVAQFDSTGGISFDGTASFHLADERTIRRIFLDGTVATAAGRPELSSPLTGVGGNVAVQPHRYVASGGGYVFWASGGYVIQRLEVATGLVEAYVGTSGSGFQDGADAKFRNPRGMVVAPDGTLYIADMENQVIRKVTTDRVTSTFAGLPLNGGYADGSGATVRFASPTDVVMDSAGNLYVADSNNYRIRKITPAGVVSTLAGNGQCARKDGTGTGACFGALVSLTIDPSDNLYVVDNPTGFLNTSYIRKVTTAGVVTTIGQTASGAFVLGSIAFYDGSLYLPLHNETRVVRMDLAGNISHFTGNFRPIPGLVNGPKSVARFYGPTGIDSDSAGSFFICEAFNNVVRKIDGAGMVSTFATGFNFPTDVAVDASDNVYVADTSNHVIWRITPAGSASVLAGALGLPGYLEGTGMTARFRNPRGVYVSGTTVYVADSDNHVIRAINSLGETSLVAGLPGSSGSVDGSGFNVRFDTTRDVVGDSSGNLYVSDGQAIRKIDTLGNVTTFAGNGTVGGSADGTGTAARFASTKGIDIDATGNFWIADSRAIRKVTSGAVVTTEAGVSSADGFIHGTGTTARFAPQGLATTSNGIFIADDIYQVILQGTPAIDDRATIDSTQGAVGTARQLGSTTGVATTYEWSIIRRPANSTATLSATNVRFPTFTPDVPDIYRFRLVATNASGTTISEVGLSALVSTPTITGSTPHFHALQRPTTVRIYGTNFQPAITATVGGVPYPVTYISSQQVRITLPPAVNPTADTHNIVLTNPDSQTASLQHWFVSGPEGGYGRGDFNGDGREEIFWRNLATGENALWAMNGVDPSQIAISTYLPAVSTDWTVAAFGDFNNDGTTDIAWRNYHTGENAIWIMSSLALSQGVYISSVDSPVQWHIAGAGDVNGDGFADIIWRNYHPDQLATGVWFMNGTNRIGTLALPATPSTGSSGAFAKYDQIVTVRDFNGDSRADLLWRNTNQSTQQIWVLDGTSNPPVSVLPATSARPRVAGDFDGDGDPDIVFENPYAYWTMNGAVMSSGVFLPAVADANMMIKGAARIGNDPRAALLWRNFVSGENAYWYVNAGGASITGAYMPSVPDSNWEIIGPR